MALLLYVLALLQSTGGGVAAPRRGRHQRARSQKARTRLPDLSRYYRGRLADVEPGAFEFSAVLIRPGGGGPISLDRHLESVEWADEEEVLRGSLTLRRGPEEPRAIPVLAGHRIRLRVRYRGSWRVLWTMRCGPPQTALGDNTVTVEVADDLQGLRRNRRDWSFRRTKRRKRGFFAHEIARRAARREGVRIRRLARGTKRIKKLKRENASALSVIAAAYAEERKETGRRYVIRMTDGALEVIEYKRNPILYVFREQITAALLEQGQRQRPVTVIDARGRLGKARGSKKVRARVFRRAVVRRFGWVAVEKNYGRVDGPEELRRKAKRDLAKQIRPRRTATLTVPGVPFIRRGDGCRWVTEEPGWHGKEVEHSRDRTFVYVRSIRHSVSSSGYTTEMTVVQEDPFRKDRERKDREARERKKRERERRR